MENQRNTMALTALGSGSEAVLSRVRSAPQLRLEPLSEAVTSVVFHARTIARIKHDLQIAEIAVPSAHLREVLAGHDGVEAGSIGVTVHLMSPSDVQTAIALIRESRDQGLYGWQALASSP